MQRQGITRALIYAGILAGVVSISAAEKIKFSTPSQSSGIASEDREIPKSSPSLFDKFRNGGADALSMPMPQPQNRAPQQAEDKQDWIFGKTGGSSSAEDRFKKRSNEERQPAAKGLGRYVEGVERQNLAAQQLDTDKAQERSAASDFSDRETRLREEAQSALGSPDLNKAMDKFGGENFSLRDYWKETTGLNTDRFAEQADLRRTEFQQIFEPRVAVQANTTVDATAALGQTLKGVTPAPTDYSSRTSQSSVSGDYQNGYMPLTGARTSVFDDANARALGRDSSSPLNTRIEQPKVLSQPAILPFPNRPGELFKRPGSY